MTITITVLAASLHAMLSDLLKLYRIRVHGKHLAHANYLVDFSQTAVRLDLRHLKSSGRHGPRSQVLVISDQTSGLEVKRMVAEKNGLNDHLVSQLDLIATVSSGKSPAGKGTNLMKRS